MDVYGGYEVNGLLYKWAFTLQTEWFIIKLTLLNSHFGGFNPFSDTSKTSFLVELSIRPQYLAISNPPMFMGKSRVNQKSVKCPRPESISKVYVPIISLFLLAAEITFFVKICMYWSPMHEGWTLSKNGRQRFRKACTA